VTSDVHPRFEYLAGRTQLIDIPYFLNRIWPAWGRKLLAAVEHDPYFKEALPAARNGVDLTRLNALERAKNRSEHKAEIRRLHESLPSDLISVPDPSALEVWNRRDR
jgi:hypothetical protein